MKAKRIAGPLVNTNDSFAKSVGVVVGGCRPARKGLEAIQAHIALRARAGFA